MRQISRRNFLSSSLFLTSSALLLPSWLTSSSGESHLKNTSSTKAYPSYLDLEEKALLSERVEKLDAYYESCHLCPRDCRVNRKEGKTGRCQASAKVKISSAFPHFGEERPLVGQKGSGTIFFSNCGLRCVFCQNYEISIEGEGVEISDQRLAEAMIKVQKMGCHNINLVTPTHYVPSIVRAVELAIPKGLKIPLVYNTSGYEKLDVLQLLDGVVDIYLPDCKYMNPEHAAKYSDGAYNYPYYAQMALKEMHRQVGILQVDRRGIAVRGVLLRHLILPNRISGTEEFLKFVARDLSKDTYLNLMAQYRPEHKASEYPKISRRLKRGEYTEAIKWAETYGLGRLAR